MIDIALVCDFVALGQRASLKIHGGLRKEGEARCMTKQRVVEEGQLQAERHSPCTSNEQASCLVLLSTTLRCVRYGCFASDSR